ncbi:MAG: hypothetical protein K0R65_5 [Crocinitomicaceae bacterium]|jgi:3-oxoacyl-[acyl-carrier-protein] synthase-3|nr:hypothetical protein [Crocinitomicaceae bacterium]
MIGIKAIKPFIAGEKTNISSLREYEALNEQELEYLNSAGIKTVYDAENYTSYDLALEAARKLFAEEEITPQEINAIIYIKSRVPEYFVASEATRLQHDLGIENCLTFSVSDLGCVDSTLAVKMAKDLLISNSAWENVLIVYGSKKFTEQRFRFPVTMTGDGGVACVIGRTDRNVIEDVKIESNGKYWDLFKIDFRNELAEQYKEECTDLRKYGFELALESRNRFDGQINSILTENGLQKEEINAYVMQNISARAFQYYEDAFGIKISPFCKMNLGQYGHLGSADILLNYQLGLQAKMIKPGSRVLILNNSPVAAWSTILIKA